MATITPEQRQLVEKAGETPVVLTDPRTREAFVLIREASYRRLQERLGLEMGPLSIEEQRAALAHAGKIAGWDDPAMDVYNDLDPRRRP